MSFSKNTPKSPLFLPEDLPLFEYNQLFSAGSMWLAKGMENQVATFDLFVRDLPEQRNFFLFGGLEEMLQGLTSWRYTPQQAKALLEAGIITPKFEKYLRTFKFTGDVWAMPEGTAFFAGEPVVRIVAPIIEANLITMFLINALVSNTIFMSKAVRCVLAAAPKAVIGIYGVRAHSFESSMKSARNSYLVGTQSLALPSFYRKYNLPIPHGLSIAYHAFIKSFPRELDAMRTAAQVFGKKIMLMVDTYDFKQGLRNAITVAKELGSFGGVMIDSGDLASLARYTRKELDKAGLKDAKIALASNLDEYKIAKLQAAKAPANSFLVVTEGVTVADAPKLETVYKMAQIQEGKKVKFTAKFAPGKFSFPGTKQVFRTVKNGMCVRDTIGLENEHLGVPLLKRCMRKGKVQGNLPSLEEIKNYIQQQLASLPPRLRSIEKQKLYPVAASKKLLALQQRVRAEH